MEMTGKIAVALGLGALAGAALRESARNREQRRADIANEQERLQNKIDDQNREIDRLRREQNRLALEVEKKSAT